MTAQERLAAQQAQHEEAKAAQLETDENALADVRERLGVAGCAAVSIPFTPGLPILAVARKPKKIEFKRFQDRCAEKDAGTAGAVKAAEELAAVVLEYPSREVFAEMAEACPGVVIALGSAAAGLASAQVREDRKS